MATSARSSRPQSQGTATLPGMPSLRATSFQLVPRQRGQSSLAILPFEVRSPVRVFEGLPRAESAVTFFMSKAVARSRSPSRAMIRRRLRGDNDRGCGKLWIAESVLLFAIQFGKLFLQAAQFRQIVDHDVGIVRMMLHVVLVVFLGGVKPFQRHDDGDDLLREDFRRAELGDVRLRDFLLTVIRIEDG